MICHDSPARRPIRRPAPASFTAPNDIKGRRPGNRVNAMTIHIELPNRRPQLFNWLAVLVLLSLGVLL
jgi:hypothetical protein